MVLNSHQMYFVREKKIKLLICTCILFFRSTITGVPKVKRDKYSVFNFLNFTSNEPIEEKSVSQESEMKALPAPETKQGLLPENLVF